jgi:NAD(P)-dependent dehydrogenase (short-subunit alcohol dehydrogenase family)
MAYLADEETRRKLERYLPGKRLARPEEIAGAAVFLASAAGEYTTGQTVWIDDGALSHV